MGFIYMLTSPYGKSYIGQTNRPIEERLKEHPTKPGCVAIYRAIQKHGWDNFEKHWYEVPDEELNAHEELMVEVLGTLVPDGYNLMKGGGSKGSPCEEVKKKMSEAQKGRTHPDEVKQKISEANSGENHPFYGQTHTDDTRKKMSANQPGSKKVFQYELDGTFVQSFASAGEAARSLGKTDGTHIRACARGDYKSSYGFFWSCTEL
jgi:group I intron endonuclease